MTDRTIVKFMHNGIAYTPSEGVPQEEYDRVVRLAELGQVFVPATLKYPNAIYDSNNDYITREKFTVYEGLNLEGDEYLNYCLTYQHASSSADRIKIVLLRKKAGENGRLVEYTGTTISAYSRSNYDMFALDDNGVLKAYVTIGSPYFRSNNYAGEIVTMYDVTSGCESILVENIPGKGTSPDTDAINAARESFKNSVGYYTKPVLENSGLSQTPDFNWGQDTRNYYSLTYTLNQITP